MKATGIVRRLDDLGRLVIPKEIRKQNRMKEGDYVRYPACHISEYCIFCEG